MILMIDYSERQLEYAIDKEDVLNICRRAALGESAAQRKLMEMLFDRIHTTASYLTRNKEEAQDVAQMASIAILQSVGSYRGEASVQFWADRIVVKISAGFFRKKARRHRLWQRYVPDQSKSISTEEDVNRRRIRERLTYLLQKMNRRQREVVVLRYIHGYTMKETSLLCNIPLETARSRLKKGCEVLREKVSVDPVLADWMEDWTKQ